MKVLVTGASGFLGRYVVRALLEDGHSVRCIGRTEVKLKDVTWMKCDLRDKICLNSAFSGIDAVFHIASKVDMFGTMADFYSTNVLGTKNVISACLENRVKYLVYTSTPSVVFSEEDVRNADESLPYVKSNMSFYAKTKAMAEKEVLDSNRSFMFSGKISFDCSNEFQDLALKTIAIRPHLILGEGDRNLIPKIISMAKRKKLLIVGKGKNLVDISYVKDVANAHLLALKALQSNPLSTSGRAYFISQGEPIVLWEWINELLAQLNIDPISKKMPFKMAYYLGYACEKICPVFKKEPFMTRFIACQLAKDHFFDISSAKRDIGFLPKTTTDDILKIIVQEYSRPSLKII